MDPEGNSQLTQPATQKTLDPRRIGKQNSGFSDHDMADIICLLHPFSIAACREVSELAKQDSQHLVRMNDAEHANLANLAKLDLPEVTSKYAIVLRLSAQVKSPLQGFLFGRNALNCDLCFPNDPWKRVSNVHFRIFINTYGVTMLEDRSTNGTIVGGFLLKRKEGNKMRTLMNGDRIKILLHDENLDLEFMVSVPHRDGQYEEAYRKNLNSYLDELQMETEVGDAARTITPGPTGHVDLFPANEPRRVTRQTPHWPVGMTQSNVDRALPREWNGSNKYNRMGQVGKGAFATVYKVTSKFDGKPYAAKELEKRRFMKNGVLDQKVENEMNIMQKIQHPHIVKYIEHLDWENRLFIIIMEYVPGGDLGQLVGEHGRLPEAVVKVMSDQLLDALGYLHDNNITHRDVKPDNILIQSTTPFNVKLTDFGLSKIVEDEQTFLKTFCGTLLYCAPEVYSEFEQYDENDRRQPRNRQQHRPVGKRYDHAIDVWSLGGVLFYALSASPPYPVQQGISYSELLHKIMTESLNISPLIRAQVSTDAIEFLALMLQKRPEKRATVASLSTHPWMRETNFSQRPRSSRSDDVISGDELEQEASQLSLNDKAQTETVPESDDEIADDDDLNDESQENISETQHYTFGQMGQPQRLFGEVNVSAVGSAGVVPSNRLNLPVLAASFDRTEILETGSEVQDSYESEDFSTPRQNRKSQPTPSSGLPLDFTQSRSVENINNMTFDVESQSLGGAESQLENLNMKSLAPSRGQSLISFNTSKRKPTYDTSDEFEGASVADKPAIKRLKSDSRFGSMSVDEEEAEIGLYALIPPLSRVNSRRQIDDPVHKSAYWDAGDRETWHLRYPEMTQLQHDAFMSAAKARGEDFAPGKSPLWELAMRYFPPADVSTDSEQLPSPDLGLSVVNPTFNSRKPSEESLPPTIINDSEDEDLPNTLSPDYNVVFPIRIVATLESAEDSVVPGISVLIDKSFASWGRATENTHVYTPRSEPKVPKYAFRIMLWKENYDPWKNFRPWKDAAEDFYFYISTKATNGIQVNNTSLPSHEPKTPHGPSKNWTKLHDGDMVIIWRSGHDAQQTQAKLTFRCNWGGSSSPRPPEVSNAPPPPALVPSRIAKRLDEACMKAEKKVGDLAERDKKMSEASVEVRYRQENIERERRRSQQFELRRLEACRMVAMRNSRRNSPAGSSPAPMPPSSAPPTMTTAGVINPTAGHRPVPAFKHAYSELNVLRAMADEG